MESEQDEIHKSTAEDATAGNGALNAEETVEVEKESEGTRDSSSEQAENDLNVIEKIADQNEALLERTQLILDMVSDYNNNKGQLIKDLFAKIEKNDQDFVFNNILKKIYLDLILLYDRVVDMCTNEVADVDQATKRLRSVRKELLQLFRRNRIAPILIRFHRGTNMEMSPSPRIRTEVTRLLYMQSSDLNHRLSIR